MLEEVDVLIVCALPEEYNALVLVNNGNVSSWKEVINETGRYVSKAEFLTTQQAKLKIVATGSHRMGGETIAATTSHLLSTSSVWA